MNMGASVNKTKVQADAVSAVQIPRCLLHDLRNLLCVISHQSEMGQRATHLEAADLREILGRLHDTARLTVELIESERGRCDEPECFDLRMILERVAEVVRGRGAGTQVYCTLPQAPILIDGYPETLLRLCLNLALNAVDASPGGEVTLSVSSQGEAPSAADLVAGSLPQTPWVMLEVADDGPGIPKKLRDRIWDRGVTTKGTNGSGEGLALVRRLAEEAGAGIALSPDPIGRTSFRVYWPASDAGIQDTLIT